MEQTKSKTETALEAELAKTDLSPIVRKALEAELIVERKKAIKAGARKVETTDGVLVGVGSVVFREPHRGARFRQSSPRYRIYGYDKLVKPEEPRAQTITDIDPKNRISFSHGGRSEWLNPKNYFSSKKAYYESAAATVHKLFAEREESFKEAQANLELAKEDLPILLAYCEELGAKP